MSRRQGIFESSDNGRPRLPLPDRLERVKQHDDIERQIVANVKPYENLESQRQGHGYGDGSVLASRKPVTMASVSEIELTMLSPK